MNLVKSLLCILSLLCISFALSCDDQASGPTGGEMMNVDVGPIFYEPTLDMMIVRDANPAEVSRILGEFGDPCESNLDCAERWCVDAGDENVCSRTCLGDDCPEGWGCRAVSNNREDVTLICVPDDLRLCKRCESDSDCPSGQCYDLDGERVCGSMCESDEDCPTAYVCDTTLTGEGLCTPRSGSCSCDESRSGERRICEQSSSAGNCYGRQVCEGSEGWGMCTATEPVAEICNQIDDDCNGITDDIEGIGEPCSEEAMVGGELLSCQGIILCTADHLDPQCSATTPQAELCNLFDDDCDGQIDEGFDARDQVCQVGVGACQTFGVLVCNEEPPSEESSEEWTPLICNATADPTLASDEECNLIDDDCDDVIDESFKIEGEYATDEACGNCFTNCVEIFARPNGRGVCEVREQTPSCALACDDGYFNLNEVIDDGCEFYLDPLAIYVSESDPNARDDDGCGQGPTAAGGGRYPCASISYALSDRLANKRRVLVANGTYEERVTLVSGIDILGGYRADTWERNISGTASAIRGPSSVGDVKTVIAIDVDQPTLFEAFIVYGTNAVTAGANSYGVYIKDSEGGLHLRDNLIFAGAGAAGAQGDNGQSGSGGTSGSRGGNTEYLGSCSIGAAQTSGGRGGQLVCANPDGIGFSAVSGGDGGSAVCPDQNIQEGSGESGANGGGLGGGGGWGHYTPNSCYPTAGVPETGVEGEDGPASVNRDGGGGLGCGFEGSMGAISDGEWRSEIGEVGEHGQHGAGGGGGGAGGGQKLSFGYDIGGSGGGGGSGGCAAQRGAGGLGGGGSFGIFVLFDNRQPIDALNIPKLSSNIIHRNLGGYGGDGGNGGAGGDPGAGALGGALTDYFGPSFCIFPGAKGGFGARGGHGGGGGGGCGGASYDIFIWGLGAIEADYSSNVFPISALEQTSGEGGSGGNASNTAVGLGDSGSTGAYGNIMVRP